MKKYLSIAFFIVLFDQISKVYIKSLFSEQILPFNVLGSFLQFNYIINSGIVFGIGVNSILYYIVVLLSICIILYIFFLMKKIYNEDEDNNLALISFSLILGGAFGNIIDRFFVIFGLFDYHGVIDFISIGFGEYYRFPYIFNIADLSVSIGIVLFIYYNYIKDNKLNNYAEEI